MSEITGNKTEKTEIEKHGGEVDWGELEGLADKFEGDQAPEKDEALAGKVGQLREWIDIEGIAEEQDPEGLADVEQEEAEIGGRIESCQKELTEEKGKYEYYREQVGEIDAKIGNAENDLNRFDRDSSRSKFKGIKKVLGLGTKKRAKLQGKLDGLEAESEEVKRGWDDSRIRVGALEDEIKKAEAFRPKQEFLERFETPLTPEEKKEGLDFDALAELSTEEYLKLWRRLNPFYLTHATRQGVRDHIGMVYHNHGQGEFSNGLVEILSDEKKLKTPAEVNDGLSREINEETVATALDVMLGQERIDIEAMRRRGMADNEIIGELVDELPIKKTVGEADVWGDVRAVHFGQHTVLNDLYGGETENEVFFVFPTDVLASQCRLNAYDADKGLTVASVEGDRTRNNIFVWPQEKDITVDAGLTFLPKSTMVDPETGSKYATKVVEKDGRDVRVPEVDEDVKRDFVDWLSGLKMEDMKVNEAGEYDISAIKERALEAGISKQIVDSVLVNPDVFPYDLEDFLKTGDYAGLLRKTVTEDEIAKMTMEERRSLSVEKFLETEMLGWKMAENAVPAEEYWENYFRKHPEQRPAHIIYYDGNPSKAVENVLKEAGVLEEVAKPVGLGNYEEWQRMTGRGDSHKRDGVWLGFEENVVQGTGENDARLREEHDRFNRLAREMIAERYGLEV